MLHLWCAISIAFKFIIEELYSHSFISSIWLSWRFEIVWHGCTLGCCRSNWNFKESTIVAVSPLHESPPQFFTKTDHQNPMVLESHGVFLSTYVFHTWLWHHVTNLLKYWCSLRRLVHKRYRFGRIIWKTWAGSGQLDPLQGKQCLLCTQVVDWLSKLLVKDEGWAMAVNDQLDLFIVRYVILMELNFISSVIACVRPCVFSSRIEAVSRYGIWPFTLPGGS